MGSAMYAGQYVPNNRDFQVRMQGLRSAMEAGPRIRQETVRAGEMEAAQAKRIELEQVMRASDNPELAAYKWAERNDPGLYEKLATMQFQQLAQEVQINPDQAVARYNKRTGENFKLAGDMKDWLKIDTKDGQTVFWNWKTDQKRVFGEKNPAKLHNVPAGTDVLDEAGDLVYQSSPAQKEVNPSDPESYANSKAAAWKTANGIPATDEQMANWKAEWKRIGPPAVAVADRPLTPYQRVRTEFDLRKEFNSAPIVKEFDEIRKQMGRLEAAVRVGKTPGNLVATDQALVNILNKMIDPVSVVREGEYARTIQNSALLSRAVGKMDQIMAGGAGFTDVERNAIINLARSFYSAAEELYAGHASEYRGLAEGLKMDPKRVVIERTAPTGGSDRIVQRNKTTGEYRHSTDGGKTWQPGK
jgi:hypothetical protein